MIGPRRSWRRETEAADSIAAGVESLLLALGVPVTSSSSRQALRTHPHYPSLASAVDTLKGWQVAAQAFQAEKHLLPEIPLPAWRSWKQTVASSSL